MVSCVCGGPGGIKPNFRLGWKVLVEGVGLEGSCVMQVSYPRLANKQRYGRLPEVAYLQLSESVSWVQAYKRR